MANTRRAFISRATKAIVATAGILVAIPRSAHACLGGIWYLKCPYDGQVDRVDDGTCGHPCSRCGEEVFDGNVVTVVCPNNHDNRIDTGEGLATSYICPWCNTDCQRQSSAPAPSQTTTGDKH